MLLEVFLTFGIVVVNDGLALVTVATVTEFVFDWGFN
jgi:hypothetical protein